MSNEPDGGKCMKTCYRSRKDAKRVMKYLNRTKHHEMTDAYYCEKCQAYHLTSMPKQKSRDFSRYLKKQEKQKP